MIPPESHRVEYKRQLSDGLAKAAVAFLNTDGGTIYIGVDDTSGQPVGLTNIDALELVEHLGSGLPRILQAYGRECVKFSSHFTRVTFPCLVQAEPRPDVQTRSEKSSEKSSEKILQMLAESPQLTIADLAQEVGISTRAIEKQLAKLQETSRLSRIGGRKEGYWQVTGRREK